MAWADVGFFGHFFFDVLDEPLDTFLAGSLVDLLADFGGQLDQVDELKEAGEKYEDRDNHEYTFNEYLDRNGA